MNVAFFQRKPTPGASYSIENYFEGVRAHLPRDIHSTVVVAPEASRGIYGRVLNILDAPRHQGDVNHITGDIHYVSYLTQKHRTVLTIHDCGTLHRLRGFQRQIFRTAWYSIPVHRVAAVTVVSEATKQDLLSFVSCDPSRIHVVPVFVSDTFREVKARSIPEKPRILQVGTADNKNLLRTAEALTGIPCHLDIIGRLQPQHLAALEKWGVSYSHSSELSIQEVFRRYVESDVVVFASTFEGFGMPIIEANVVGRPVVCGNVTSMPEVAADAACLVDPFSVSSIRAGILKVLEDAAYRSQLVARGHSNARRFSAEAIAQQYATLYRSLLLG